MKFIRQLLCSHSWLGQGWSSHTFEEAIPPGVIRNFYTCGHCGKNKFVDKTYAEVKKDFNNYNDPDFPKEILEEE